MRIAALLILGLLLAAPAAGAQEAPFTLFPVVGGAKYTDDFGDPRGQGAHEGNDLLAPCGTPVIAVVAGTVELDYGPRSGWMVTLRGRSSWYRYIHMDGSRGAKGAMAPGLRDGSRVKEGQIISYVGNTGDAVGAPCHLHFELHYGTRTVSPYEWLRRATIVNLDPANPTALSATTGVSLKIAGTIVWAGTVGGEGRIIVRPSAVETSAGEPVDRRGRIVLRATPELVASVRAGQRGTITTAPAEPTSERMACPALAWTATAIA